MTDITEEIKDLTIDQISQYTKLYKMVYVLMKELDWLYHTLTVNRLEYFESPYIHIKITGPDVHDINNTNIELKPKSYEDSIIELYRLIRKYRKVVKLTGSRGESLLFELHSLQSPIGE